MKDNIAVIVDPENKDVPFSVDVELGKKPNKTAYPDDTGIRFWNITLEIEEKKILNGLCGYFPAGEVTALMGPTGSGKTSLMKAMAHRNQATGVRQYGDHGWRKSLRRKIAFVEQDDVVWGELSVRRSLRYLAKLRMGRTMSTEDQHARVEWLIDTLRLNKCSENKIKDCSGGERKRVCIANDLITPEVSILLLDEITSGLDSSMALTVVEVVKDLAVKNNLCVIMTIHQPSSQIYTLFDRLVLLNDKGEPSFMGPANQAHSFFEQMGLVCPEGYNTPDFFMDLLVKEGMLTDSHWKQIESAREEWYLEPGAAPSDDDSGSDNGSDSANEGIRQNKNGLSLDERKSLTRSVSFSKCNTTSEEDPYDRYLVPFSTQFSVIFERGWYLGKDHLFKKQTIILNLGVILNNCLLYWQLGFKEDDIYKRLACLMWFIGTWTFFPTASAQPVFHMEEKQIKKEMSVGAYDIWAYFLARTTISYIMDLFWMTMFAIAVYFVAFQGPEFVGFASLWGLNCITILGMQSVGFFAGATFDLVNGGIATMLFIIFCFAFSGFFNKDVQPWLQWTSFVNPFAYAYSLGIRIAFAGVHFECNESSKTQYTECSNGSGHITDQMIYDMYNVKLDIYTCVIGLVVTSVLFRYSACIALKYRVKRALMKN